MTDWTGRDGTRRVFLLLLLFASALLIRMPGLGKWCLAVDEFYFSRSVSFILEKGFPMFPGGGYYIRGIALQYLTALPVSIIGNIELAVRIVPLLFGAMTVPLFYLFCRKFLGEFESILCAIMLLLSSWHIEFSRFARMYMPFQFIFLLFLYQVHSGFRENMPRHRLAAWIIAALSVFCYEGSVIPVLLLAALVLLGDAGKTGKELSLFMILLLALLALNLAVNLVNYRMMGVSEAAAAKVAISHSASSSRIFPLVLPDLGLLAFACRSWAGRVVLVLFACAGAWLTARSVRNYEGAYSRPLLLLSLAALPVLPLLYQYGLLAVLCILFAMNRDDIRRTVWKDLPYWGIYVLLTIVFWGIVAWRSGNSDRFMHFFAGYPPIKYAVLMPFLRAIPLWITFLLCTAAFSILRKVLFRRWEEDTFPITILVLCLVIMAVFRTPYKESRYSFFYFPLFLLVAMGEMRFLRLYLSGKAWPALGRKAGALLLTIPLAVFLSTEDFHLRHVTDVSSADINFRTGPYLRYADHWYPRFDFLTPGRFVEGQWTDGDIVVLEQVAMSQYVRKPFLNYVTVDSERYKGIARNRGTEEMWSGSPLISDPGQLASRVPGNGRNSLWIIGVVWDFHGEKSKLENRYEKIAREHGLVIENVFLGIDGRTGVLKVTRGMPGDRSARPGIHAVRRIGKSAEERKIT